MIKFKYTKNSTKCAVLFALSLEKNLRNNTRFSCVIIIKTSIVTQRRNSNCRTNRPKQSAKLFEKLHTTLAFASVKNKHCQRKHEKKRTLRQKS